MAEIKINIKNCSNCPFLQTERDYTADSFELLEKWKCGKCEGKIIARYVEVWDVKNIVIPEWCPIVVKEEGQ